VKAEIGALPLRYKSDRRLCNRRACAYAEDRMTQKILMATAALATVILAAPVAADDAAKGGVAVALQFSQCAGLYYAVADLGPEAGQSPDDVQLAREMGNGAALVAQYVLAQVRAVSQQGEQITPDVWRRAWEEAGTYTDDQVASNRGAWRSRIRGSSNPQVFAEQVEICDRLNPLQAQIVQEMRQDALTAPWGDR
jgi:hypothetical protein